MNIDRLFLLAILATVLVTAGCASRLSQPMACEIARQYIEAGNSGAAQEIAPLLVDDVAAVFLAEAGGTHSVLQGKAAVLDAVRNYTAQCPDCRSTVRCLHATSGAVYAVEDVVFVDQDGVGRSQSAPLVIELDGDRIRAIVYYPSFSPASTAEKE